MKGRKPAAIAAAAEGEGGVVTRLPLARAKELGLVGSGRMDWSWVNDAMRRLAKREEVVVLRKPDGVEMATFRMRVLTSGRRILRPMGWRVRTQGLEGGRLSVWKEGLGG